MSDMADVSGELEQLDRERAIAKAKRSAPELPAVGQCYNCLERLPEGVRFCDSDCRNDYAARKSAEARNG